MSTPADDLDLTSPTDLRASDEDRRRAMEALREHAGAGRLDVAELDARLDAVLAARTLGDLRRLLADLPPLGGHPPARQRRSHFLLTRPIAAWLALGALLVVVWAATGGGYFWPVWPILGTSFKLAPWARHRGRGAGWGCSAGRRSGPGHGTSRPGDLVL